ncbi:MAG: hypothetical protein CMB64_03760 [Euryarchaeota archaeon]|nr:hypothetical protein [Euryarchaeota archaeon]|tara:strand:- start:325 stop:1437 length:1113 start_codon:yes stop_codon:yes gene_type:complete
MEKKIINLVKKRTNESIVILLLLTMSFSGCVSESNETELVIATYDVYALTDEMIGDFENQTGITVSMIKLDDAGSVLDYLIQNKGTETIDLAIGLDNTYLQTAIKQGVLTEHLANNLDNISQDALAPYNGPFAVPFDMGHVCLNYDSSIVDGQNMTVPTSLWNLTEEEWRGKVAIPSPITSSPGRAFMLATLDYFNSLGESTSEFEEWWSAMEENDVIITSGWSEAYETHYTGGYGEYEAGYVGDAHITVSYCHSPGVESWYNGNWTKSAALNLPKTSFFQVEYISSVMGGDQQSSALFIEFLLSEDINSNMPVQNSMYSVLEGFDLPEENGYLFHSIIPNEPSEISMIEIEENMESWLLLWNKAMTSGE